MDLENIKSYWDKRSKTFETDLKATTNHPAIKMLEIDALLRTIKRLGLDKKKGTEILEVGCGNGPNCFALSELLPNLKFTGLDYSEEMVRNANRIKKSSTTRYPKVKFYLGDVLNLGKSKNLKNGYDVIFTDRCLINLNSKDLQLVGINNILKKLKRGGYFIMLENSIQNYARQNEMRKSVGLPERKPAKYNLFIDETVIIPQLKKSAKLLSIDDFGSLHDIILYVLIPSITKGVVDYNHPLVKTTADLSIALSENYNNPFGNFGQNRLFLFRKK